MELLDTPVSTATQMPHSKLPINVPGVMIRKAIHAIGCNLQELRCELIL
jgi:hypothetical protein